MQSYFQPALQGDIASYTSSPKRHVDSAALVVDHQPSLPWDGAPHRGSPATVGAPVAAVAGSIIPSWAKRKRDSGVLPVGTAVVLCRSHVGGMWAGRERAIKTDPDLTLREALPVELVLSGTGLLQLHQAGGW